MNLQQEHINALIAVGIGVLTCTCLGLTCYSCARRKPSQRQGPSPLQLPSPTNNPESQYLPGMDVDKATAKYRQRSVVPSNNQMILWQPPLDSSASSFPPGMEIDKALARYSSDGSRPSPSTTRREPGALSIASLEERDPWAPITRTSPSVAREYVDFKDVQVERNFAGERKGWYKDKQAKRRDVMG